AIVEYDRFSEDRRAIAEGIAERSGACLIPPFDHPEVIAGQGTCGLELAEQVPDLDTVLVCVGGGGLMAGCATALTSLQPGVEVRGVEPSAADDTYRSFAAGHPVEIPQPDTIADGLAPRRPGDMTFEMNRRLVSGIDLVEEHEMAAAMRFLFERLKLVVEPSGAAALAAVMSGRVPVEGRRVGVTLTGGNIDTGRFAEILSRYHDGH
ncbi:MAG TPA: pyridoxal-phosphate dependent enzyme, partial [Acidimicrobiales bacterium]|nr:pyridoxal-phosphate dependent enzyme [Acidimicrobiales bacterium]